MTLDLAHTALLPAVPPFSLTASLAAMSGFRPSAGDQLILADRLRKGLPHPDEPREAVVVQLGPRPDAAPGVLLDVYAARPLSETATAEVERWVRGWLGLDDDMRPFLELAADDPPVAALLPLVHGLHQVRFGSLAEGTTYFALTQRSTQWFATARKARIAAELGPRAQLDGETFVAFPGLAELARLGADGLFSFAGNAQRALRLAEILTGVAALDEAELRTAPYEEARQALLGVRGIGTFTASAILLRVLGRPDDVPLEMTQFTTAMTEVYGATPPTPAELRERYGSYVGWWAYLCRTALGHQRRATAASATKSEDARGRRDGAQGRAPAAEIKPDRSAAGARPRPDHQAA
jgi:DNA-3-methyladenine glycosylase II